METAVLNFNANDYIDLIYWQTEVIYEPPSTKRFTNDELNAFLDESAILEVKQFPCHTQATGRYIKLVTAASIATCGTWRRDGIIHTKTSARKARKKYCINK